MVVGVLAGLLAAPAGAQLPTPQPGLSVPDYGAMITQNTLLGQALGQPGPATRADRRAQRPARRGTPSRRRAARRPTARQRATLRFAADPAVSAAVDRDFVERFGVPGVDPELVLADLTALRRTAEDDLRRIGWSTADFGDVAAYGLVVAYGVLTGDPIPAAGAARVRAAVRDALAAQRSVRRLSDARQQELAETLLLRVAYSVGWINDRVARGDEAGADEVRDSLRRFARDVYGLDPLAVRLTRRGFVARE